MNLKRLYILLLAVLIPQLSEARPMLTDLSERKIDIDAKYTGKEILLYGARIEAGNIIIVIRGPGSDFMVRKKENIGGVWVNTSSVKFLDVPHFYRIHSSEPVSELNADELLRAIGVGFDTVKFNAKPSSAKIEINSYQEALISKLKSDDLFDFEVINLPFLEGTLFRIRVKFPEKIRDGVYTAEIYSFNEGLMQGMQSIPIKVDKVGMEAFIYNAAHNSPTLYGLIAVMIAVLMGLGAGRLFRKV